MRSLLAALLIVGSTSVASAGGYVGLGIGTGPGVGGELPYREDGRSGRLELGYRLGHHLAIEGMGSRSDMMYGTMTQTYQWQMLGLAAKYNLTLGDRFEIFGRLGVQHTSFDDERGNTVQTGNGMLYGGGFEYRIGLGAEATIFVDYTVHPTKLMTTGPEALDFDFSSRVWTLGATLGF